MPIPKPHAGEAKQDFISRCMGDKVMVDEYEQEQRAGICYSQWNREHGGEDKESSMRIYLPIAKVDAEKRMVFGYASTEARDDQGEIVKREALDAALGDYMKFANIREMHQLSAVGKAKDATVDEKGLYIGAKIVDDQAWNKVVERVYQGFSIGGKVTSREPADYKTITGLRLDEISLVDRPANPEAVFDCWKRSGDAKEVMSDQSRDRAALSERDHNATAAVDKAAADPLAALAPGEDVLIGTLRAAIERLEAVAKKGDDGGDDKPYGDVEYADPGYQEDKKKRYPIDSEKHIRAAWNYINKPKNAGKYSADQVKHIKSKIVSAWKDKIDPEGPPSADDGEKAARIEMRKSLADVGGVAQTIMQLDWLKDMLATEAAMEGDTSPQPERLGGIIDELCGFLNALVAEETAEIRSDDDLGEGALPMAGMAMAAVASSLAKSGLDGRAKLFAVLAKARHSMGDQALLDMAHHAVKTARSMDGLKVDERDHLDECMKSLEKAGATVHSTQNTAGNPEHSAPQVAPPAQEYRPGAYTTVNTAQKTAEVLDAIAQALGKAGRAHKALMDAAHGCIKAATDGETCKAEKAGSRHSKETLGHLQEAHDHLCAAGAKCDVMGTHDAPMPGGDPERGEEEGEGTEFEPGGGKASRPGDLKKRYDALSKAVAELAPRLDQIAADVAAIKRTPLPALTVRSAAGLARIEKGRDGGDPIESDADLMARIAAMTPDQQAMLLIKASRLKPFRIAPGGPQPLPEGGQ